MSFVKLSRGMLRQVEKPARYLGGEWNMVEKEDFLPDGRERIHFAFCFPDRYEVGMSNLALRIIYGLLNESEDIYCERAFAPDTDMHGLLLEKGLPYFAVETGRPLSEFDFLGFTLQYEMSFPTILDMIDHGGVSLRQKDRQEGEPFVVAGGPVAFSVEPMADFFDLVMLGEGEEMLPELLDAFRAWKKAGEPREKFLERAAGIPGVYVPSFYAPEYGEKGEYLGVHPIHPAAPEHVKKRIVRDLDKSYVPEKVLVPNVEIVHDRIFLELYRGCANGCRFCQAGMIYRPIRERSAKTLLAQAEAMIASSGYEEIGLLSLSSGDYSELTELTNALVERCEKAHINLSLPSLRLDSVSLDLLDKASRTRKTGLTFAPEAGTQKERDVINKNIREEDLLSASAMAFEKGWDRLKLYFMLGLPDETDEDILGIAELADELCRLREETVGQSRRKLRMTVSTSFFIPKPWTPFQWDGQISLQEMERQQALLMHALENRYITYDWHSFETSVVEALLAKGDRRVGDVIERVYKNGGRMESERWGFSYERWLEAAEHFGISIPEVVERERGQDEVFPWDHLDPGVKKSFLWREREKSKRAETSAGCRKACQGCGMQIYKAGTCPGAEV